MSFQPAPGEKLILDEDCAEDKLRSGLLFLTNRRIVFQKTLGQMATFSKKEGEVLLDIPLDRVTSVRAEGFLVKKLAITSGNDTFKFGVLNNRKWERQIKEAKSSAS